MDVTRKSARKWIDSLSLRVQQGLFAAATYLILLAICLLRVLGILLVLPVYGTMECIVMIYIASWIAAGVSFLLLWHRDAAHISR